MKIGKLNPQYVSGTAKGKINFPGFQEILDFTSAGSESSVSVAVDGDTDKEYTIYSFNPDSTKSLVMRLNADAGNCGYQRLYNNAGTIGALRNTTQTFMILSAGGGSGKGLAISSLLTPSGFIKTLFDLNADGLAGTGVNWFECGGYSWNSTANVTSLVFYPNGASGNFTSGTRITVFARRSNV